MDTLLSLKIFAQIVESGSFTRAAECLGISTAMASKHLSHLEKHLGIRLMQRNSRSLSLTAEGEVYYRQSIEALQLLDAAAAQAGSGRETPQGHLRLTAPIWCANPVFADWMREYRARYPEVSLDIILDNDMRDLIGEGIDLALRVSRAPIPSLVVRRLFEVRFALVASPAYIRRHGLPRTLEDAASHSAVLPSYADISRMDCRRGDESHTLHLHSALQSTPCRCGWRRTTSPPGGWCASCRTGSYAASPCTPPTPTAVTSARKSAASLIFWWRRRKR